MQQSRRSNPYPYTWEIPLAMFLAVVLLLFLGVHLGRAVANFWAGAGLTVLSGQEMLTSWVSVLKGDAGAGLSPRPDKVAGTTALRTWIIVSEACIIAGLIWAARVSWVHWGPGTVRGVATNDEVEQVVGRARLHKQAHVIRPDLYAKKPNVIHKLATQLKGDQR
ncbi:hypothetical protein [Janibacter alittae]|uniref:Conjugal transfer protein n=1 Tax=Janibacter alittae TaxID=3115209 RepID=A0ABZ2MLB7_9MICO